jgi:hypothetical protein
MLMLIGLGLGLLDNAGFCELNTNCLPFAQVYACALSLPSSSRTVKIVTWDENEEANAEVYAW